MECTTSVYPSLFLFYTHTYATLLLSLSVCLKALFYSILRALCVSIVWQPVHCFRSGSCGLW